MFFGFAAARRSSGPNDREKALPEVFVFVEVGFAAGSSSRPNDTEKALPEVVVFVEVGFAAGPSSRPNDREKALPEVVVFVEVGFAAGPSSRPNDREKGRRGDRREDLFRFAKKDIHQSPDAVSDLCREATRDLCSPSSLLRVEFLGSGEP
ncbi:MAG: hypothetical protein AB7T06_37000, partial [Kofleriaceae bacterium]